MPEAKGDVVPVVHTKLDFVEFVFPRPAVGYVGGHGLGRNSAAGVFVLDSLLDLFDR
jgi:hypothetical protein